MVADKVEIISRSYKASENEAARGNVMDRPNSNFHRQRKTERGTDVILHINADSEEFLDEWRMKGILEKYCKFLPVEIKFGTKEESVEDGVDAEGKPKYKTVTEDRIINNPSPLWTKSPTN